MRRLARQLVQDESRVDDAVQDAWLMALRSSATPTRPTRSWIATVVRNAVRQGWRREQRRQAHEEQAARPEATSPRPTLEHEEILERVVGAVLSLDEPYRRAVLLRFYEDLPPRRIAERLELPIETVRTRLRRGLAQLRARLDADVPERRSWLLALVPFVPPPSPIRSGAHAMIHSPVTWTTLLAVPIVLVASQFTASHESVTESLRPVSFSEVDPIIDPASGGESRPSASQTLLASSATSASRGTAHMAEAASAPIVARRVSAHDDAVAMVRGRLFDPDGAPVPGAELTLHGWGRSGKSEKQDVTSSSAADGTFEISITPNEENQYTLRVDHTELARIGWRWHELTKGQEIDLGDVTMPWTGRIEGRLLNKDREPIGDTRPIQIVIHAEPEGHFVPHRGTVYSASGVVDPLTSTFVMERVPVGRSRLKLESYLGWSEGPEVEVTARGLTPIDVVYTGHALRNVIYVAAMGVDSEHIRLTGSAIEPRFPERALAPSYSHVFEDVPDGSYTITMDDPRYVSVVLEDIEPGPVPVLIRRKASSGLLLTVVDAEDGSIISSYTYNGDAAGSGRENEPTFLIEGLRSGRDVEYRIGAPGYAEAVGELEPLQPGEIRSVRIELTPPGRIHGVVRFENGEPAPSTKVSLYLPAEADDSSASIFLPETVHTGGRSRYRLERESKDTDTSGYFEFPGLSSDRYILLAKSPTGLITVRDSIHIDASDREPEVELTLPPGVSLHGRVHGPEGSVGSPLWLFFGADYSDVPVFKFVARSTKGAGFEIDVDGSYRTTWLPPGRLHVWAGLDEYARPRIEALELGPIDLSAPGVVRRDFDLGEEYPGTLDIRVRVNGEPSIARDVSILAMESSKNIHVNDWLQGAVDQKPTDSEGRLRLPLFGGQYRVAIVDSRWVHMLPNPVPVHPGETESITIDVALFAATIQVVDAATGDALRDAEVLVRTKGLGNAGRAANLTDPQGHLELELPEGEYELYLAPKLGSDPTRQGSLPKAELRWTAAGPEPAVLRFER